MRYNRKILVPYLRSVVEAEMIYECLKSRKIQLENQINNCQWHINNFQNASEPYCRRESPIGCIIKIAIYIICSVFVMGIVFSVASDIADFAIKIAIVILVIDIGIGIGWSAYCIYEYNDFNNYIFRGYKSELEKWNKLRNNYENSQQNINVYRVKLKECNSAFETAKQERLKVYSSNIVAEQYRDVYSATYLYRYFNTSMEDDLDKIIQTLLLDNIQNTLLQIKNELREIFNSINRMGDYLSNISNEMKNISETTESTQKSIANLESNDELKMNYLNMIDCNTRLTAFVTTANYLNSFR